MSEKEEVLKITAEEALKITEKALVSMETKLSTLLPLFITRNNGAIFREASRGFKTADLEDMIYILEVGGTGFLNEIEQRGMRQLLKDHYRSRGFHIYAVKSKVWTISWGSPSLSQDGISQYDGVYE